MNATRVADMTVDELKALIQTAVREVLEQHAQPVNAEPEAEAETPTDPKRHPQWGILEIPKLNVDPRHPALTIISREDMYGDDGR